MTNEVRGACSPESLPKHWDKHRVEKFLDEVSDILSPQGLAVALKETYPSFDPQDTFPSYPAHLPHHGIVSFYWHELGLRVRVELSDKLRISAFRGRLLQIDQEEMKPDPNNYAWSIARIVVFVNYVRGIK